MNAMTLEGVGEVTAPRTVQSGGGITLNANTNSGFVFQDWLLNGTARSGNPLILSNITANQSVTARWQIVTQSPQVGIGFVSETTNSLSFNTATQNAPSGAFLKWEFFDGQSWLGYNNVQPNTLSGINIVQGLGPNTTYRLRAVLRDESDNQTLAVSETVQGTTSASTIAPPVITAPDISTTIYSPVSNYVIGLQNADSYSVTGLPPWLSQSGVFLSGEPTVAHIGNSSFTITAINAGGTTTKTVAVQVLWPALNADLVLTQGDYVSQVAYASSTLQAGELILQPKHGSLPNGLSLNVRRQNPITIEGGTVGDIELVGTPTQTGIFYAEYEMTVTYYEPFRQDVLPLRLRIEVVPSGGGSGFSTMSAMSVMEGTSGGEMSAMSNGSSGGSFIPDTLRLNAYQPNATARKVVQLLPGFSTVDANGQSRPFSTAIVGGTNAPPVVSGDSVVITTRSDYELGASGNLLSLHTVDNFGRDEREFHHEFGFVDNLGNRTLFVRDMLGSTRAVLKNGTMVEWNDYYAYGAVRDSWSLANGRWKYLGAEADNETATLHLDAREYDPFVGFTQIDPLGLIPSLQGYSPYIYTRNNPLTRKDPRGLADDDWFQKLYKTISDFIAGGGPVTVRDTPTAQEVARNKSEPINKAGEVLGGLSMVAKSVSDEANKAVKTAPKNLVKAGIKLSDDVSDASTMVAGLGIMAIPVTFGESLTGTAFAMTVGSSADLASALLKTIDYFNFDGSLDDLIKAYGKVGVGVVTNKLLGGLPESGFKTIIKFSIETPSTSAIDGKLNTAKPATTP